MTVLERLHPKRTAKLSAADYERLCDEGALADLGRIELIDGEIVNLNAQARPHLRAKRILYLALHAAVSEFYPELTVFGEGTIALLEKSAPEPDVFVTSDPDGSGFVPGNSVPLVIEISVGTLAKDLGVKSRLYARGGVPECWVVDVEGRALHQFWNPSSEGYANSRMIAFGDSVTSTALPSLCIDTPSIA